MGSDKQAVECDVGLGLRMHHQQQQQQLSSAVFGAGDGSVLFRQGGNDDGYDVVGAQTRNPMNCFTSDLAFKSQVPIRGPISFTKAQWQELERQTVVYNFLSASVPVPPQLLIPINGAQANPPVSHRNRLLNFGLPTSGTDQEPWRCRRTDGKKWRCSRDIAPDQKYCERHAHKNRPRSRKHVELHTANLTSSPSLSIGNKKHQHTDPKASSKVVEPRPQLFSQNETQLSPYPTLASYDHPRSSYDWFAKCSTSSANSLSQQWTQIMQPKEGFTASNSNNFFKDVDAFKQQKESHMGSSDLGINIALDSHNQNDPCGLLLGPKLPLLNDELSLDQTQRPRGFIDAWSTADGGDSISQVSHDGTFPISSLTLSMSRGNEESPMEHLDIGLMYGQHDSGSLKSQQPMMNWMSNESWMGSTPGGPLAEALCLGISSNVKSGSSHQTPSPYGRSSNTANTKLQSSSDESGHGIIN